MKNWRKQSEHQTSQTAQGELRPARSAKEQREHGRQMTTLRVAKLATEAAQGLGIIRNASAGGMMIDALISFEPGQKVTIHLSDEQQVEGKVVWHKERLTGVQFDQRVDIDRVLAKPRVLKNGLNPRLPRLECQFPAELKVGAERVTVLVCDISQRGVKLEMTRQLEPNEKIVVSIDGLGTLHGSVRWIGDDQVGIELHEILPISQIMKWAARQNADE